MSDIVLQSISTGSVTCISNSFIDDYMVDADGEYVKIYLYLLRCAANGGSGLSVSNMSEVLEHTQKDIKKGLLYWEKQGLLRLGYDNENDISSILLTEPSPAPTYSFPQTVVPMNAEVVYEQAASPIQIDDEAKNVYYIAEKFLGHTFSANVIDSIDYWHDSLLLSWDLIEHIIERCAENGTVHLNYLNKIAMEYSRKGISTVEEARTLALNTSNTAVAVKKAFGISGRNLAEAERLYIDKWSGVYGFGSDLISEACGRTILKIQRPSFEYADTILKSWHENGIKTFEDLEKSDRMFLLDTSKRTHKSAGSKQISAKRVHNFPEREADLSGVEKQLLQS